MTTRTPAAAIWSRKKRSSAPFVSSVPATITGATPPRCIGRSSTAGVTTLLTGSGAAVCVRAVPSICAAGTGCDQRVGGLGFDV